jgi:hypothetical protein
MICRRRDVLAAAASLLLPQRAHAAIVPIGSGKAPAAVNRTGWMQKSNWNFGVAAGNNIREFTDWLAAGWFMDETPHYLNDECETYNTLDRTNGNLNFQPFAEHCDIVAIWNGGPVASARGNGSISSLMMHYDVPSSSAIGYYELTCKIPSVSGAWPAWWTIGHVPGSPEGASTWGPEIDIFEFYDTKTKLLTSTLHGSTPRSRSFLPESGYPRGTPQTPATRYEGDKSYDLGHFIYQPGTDFAEDYHRFGLRIAADYAITVWVDDISIGQFHATQYADDFGKSVGAELLVNLALGTHNPDPVRSIHPADFGGAGNRGPTNRFRFSLKNIQIWGPS